MNTNHIEEYFRIKADIDSLTKVITEKRTEIDGYKNKAAEIKANIAQINQALDSEERKVSIRSATDHQTMTGEQFMAEKKKALMMEVDLQSTNETIVFLNKSLSSLNDNLESVHKSLENTVNQISADMRMEYASKLVESAGDQFKGLVMAVIAKAGKMQGHSLENKQLFIEKTSLIVCELIYLQLFGNGSSYTLPDLHEANQHVVDVIESVA